MSITNGYATLAQVKRRLNIPTATTADDTDIEEAIESASREIDKHCGRRFYADAAATARTYYPDKPCRATVDDFYETAALVVKIDSADDGTYGTTLTLNTDYILKPLNGVVDGESGWPYWKIELVGSALFPTWTRRPSIQVTAKWGWSAVPKPVYEACRIIAAANYYLKDVKFGSAGVADLGIVRVTDNPTAAAKVRPYRLHSVLVA